MNSTNPFLKLNDIVDKTTMRIFSLPNVQRGFVWKPYQIENLWDSLLRGYPVGCFVLSRKENSQEQYELLDGQQRATSICLGFSNPLNQSQNSALFKTSYDNYMIFVDLLKPNKENDNRKYLFRVITKSHPWGYRRLENHKTLDSNNISKARRFYKIENYSYLKKPLVEFWPYDSYRPIPLGLFIHAENEDDLIISIQRWKREILKIQPAEELHVIDKKNESADYYTIKEIFVDVKNMLKEQQIPTLQLNFEKLYADEVNTTRKEEALIGVNSPNTDSSKDENIEENDDTRNDEEQSKIENRQDDEIENLFIRLNSGGTRLQGEELNYSILKSKIDLAFQEKIEERCKGLFYPPRFITIAFRLFNNFIESNVDGSDATTMRVKPRQFQRIMSDEKRRKKFINFLQEHLLNSHNDIIESAKEILVYNKETHPTGLPKFIAYSLAEKAPEIMFMLLYRILIKKDNLQSIKQKVLGMVTLFTWLGKGDQKDHSKLLRNIWPCIKHFDIDRFWTQETVQRALLKDYRDKKILTPFPKLNKLKNIMPENEQINSLKWDKIWEWSPEYGDFINKIFYEKDIILYSQRHVISEWFGEIEDYNLDDTNRAFDWDHLCPENYIRRLRGIHQALKDWYGSNGNIRAWPYSLNRSDSDNSPSYKFNPVINTDEDLLWWKGNLNDNSISNARQLKENLLNMSFCNKDWADVTEDDLQKVKDTGKARQIIYTILDRNIELCKEWYIQLNIDDLFPESYGNKKTKDFFEEILDNRMWSGEKEDGGLWTYYCTIGEANLYLYFSFYIDYDPLMEDGVYFGIYEENSVLFKEIHRKLSPEKKNKYFYGDGVFYSSFTLISFSEISRNKLFEEFVFWANNLPVSNAIRNCISKKFKECTKM